MNRYKLVKAGIEVNDGIRRFNHQKDIYEELLMTFPEDENFDKMLAAIHEGKVEEAFRAAHSLKGVTGNLSMVRLHERLLPLVELLRNGSLEQVEQLLAPVTECYKETIRAITGES